MAATIAIDIRSAYFLNATAPEAKQLGTNIPIPALFFDAATDEAAFFSLPTAGYSSGNITVTLEWYADTASSGDVVWGAALHAITPNTDTQDVESDSLATENTVTDSHLGTTGQRLHSCAITVSNLDSIAAADYANLRIRRVGSNGSDTMSGDAALTKITIDYA